MNEISKDAAIELAAVRYGAAPYYRSRLIYHEEGNHKPGTATLPYFSQFLASVADHISAEFDDNTTITVDQSSGDVYAVVKGSEGMNVWKLDMEYRIAGSCDGTLPGHLIPLKTTGEGVQGKTVAISGNGRLYIVTFAIDYENGEYSRVMYSATR